MFLINKKIDIKGFSKKIFSNKMEFSNDKYVKIRGLVFFKMTKNNFLQSKNKKNNSFFLMKFAKLSLFIILISGCSFFEPRDSAKPQESVPWNDYFITYDLTLQNLVFAYRYSQNINKFHSLFDVNYKFIFDKQDISDFNPPNNWDNSDDVNSLINMNNSLLQNQFSEITLTKSNAHSDLIFSDHVVIYRNYSLHIPHNLNNISEDFIGWFELDIKPDTYGFWKIMRWVDHRTETPWSWGRLKYEFE
jgi:hypothetical protein